MDYKVKLTKCQNKHHHGVYLTHGSSGPNPRPSGPRGRPTGRLGFESTQPGTWLTHLYVGLKGRIRGLKVVEA
jgi:hypothetical protein